MMTRQHEQELGDSHKRHTIYALAGKADESIHDSRGVRKQKKGSSRSQENALLHTPAPTETYGSCCAQLSASCLGNFVLCWILAFPSLLVTVGTSSTKGQKI